jgi:hypothetical protein
MLEYKIVKNYDSEFEPLQLSNIPLEGIKEVYFVTHSGYETSKVTGAGANLDLFNHNSIEEEKFFHINLLRSDFLFIGIMAESITLHSPEDSNGDDVFEDITLLKIIYDDGIIITVQHKSSEVEDEPFFFNPDNPVNPVNPLILPRIHPEFLFDEREHPPNYRYNWD